MRPEAVGICGSDFHLFSGDVGALSGLRDFYPRIQGHEVSAVVEDPGDSHAPEKASGSRSGRCSRAAPATPAGSGGPTCACHSGWSACTSTGASPNGSRCLLGAVFAIGDLDPDCTTFVEPASVVVHALARGRVQAGEQVVVFGAGPIGLATVLAAADAGARVLSIDPVAGRRDLAKRLGAERVAWASPAELLESVRDWTGGEGPPVVVETSGEPSVLPQAIEMVGAAGRVVVIGMSSGTAAVRPGAFPEKEIDVIGSSCATAEDFRNAVRLVSAHSASLSALFSHHFPLERAAEAFEFAMRRPQDAIKIVVTVN